MGDKAKVILNEYSACDLLHKGTINPDKFYTADLKLIIEVAQREIKKLDNAKNEIKEYINKGMYHCDGSHILEILERLG